MRRHVEIIEKATEKIDPMGLRGIDSNAMTVKEGASEAVDLIAVLEGRRRMVLDDCKCL